MLVTVYVGDNFFHVNFSTSFVSVHIRPPIRCDCCSYTRLFQKVCLTVKFQYFDKRHGGSSDNTRHVISLKSIFFFCVFKWWVWQYPLKVQFKSLSPFVVDYVTNSTSWIEMWNSRDGLEWLLKHIPTVSYPPHWP